MPREGPDGATYMCPWGEDVTKWAVVGGHLDVLKWASANGCRMKHDLLAEASVAGHVHVRRWLLRGSEEESEKKLSS